MFRSVKRLHSEFITLSLSLCLFYSFICKNPKGVGGHGRTTHHGGGFAGGWSKMGSANFPLTAFPITIFRPLCGFVGGGGAAKGVDGVWGGQGQPQPPVLTYNIDMLA